MEDNFLDIVLEAKGQKKSPPRITRIRIDQLEDDEDSDVTDYTSDEGEEEDELTGYTSEDEEEPDEEDYIDYTSTEDEIEPSDDDPEEEESDDYTEDSDLEDDNQDNETGEDAEGEPSDYTSGDSDELNEEPMIGEDQSEESEEEISDQEKNKVIINDFINLYYLTKNSIKKLSNIDKTDIFINKIVSQVITNFNTLQKQLADFLVFRFLKNKYVNNLYQYNYFLEAFKINVEMLKKISVFTIKS